MLTPLYDDNPIKNIRFAYVTYTLIIVNIIIYTFLQGGLKGTSINEATVALGLIPRELVSLIQHGDFTFFSQLITVPEQVTPLSYMFLHGSWMHLIGNMIFLFVLGDNIEDAVGHFGFLVFYLLCGIFAGLFQAWLLPELANPVIGASGAVAGVIAAYLLLHPNVFLWALAFQVIPVRLKAYWILGFWVLFQFSSLIFSEASHVAWGTHIGGMIIGSLLILIMRKPNVKLFQ